MFLKLVLVLVLVLVFVWFFVIPMAKAKVIRADRNAVGVVREGFQDSQNPSITTGLINVGDVGMPPGHIVAVGNGVFVSYGFLPNATNVANAVKNGKYVLTVKDETGKTASIKITNMDFDRFYYNIYNNAPINTGYKEYKDQDHGGDDIECHFDGRSVEYCKKACDSDPNCKAYNNIRRGGRQEGCCYKRVALPISPFPGGGVDLYVKQEQADIPLSTKFANSKKLAITISVPQQAIQQETIQKPFDPAAYIAENSNPLSQAIDSTIPNFAIEPTGIEADPNLTDIEYINKYNTAAGAANQQIKHAIANPTYTPMLETVPPVNPLVRKAKQCESLKGRASCSSLSNSKYSDCGVCLKAGTQHDGNNRGSFIGGLLSLKNERVGSITPTVGQCPPGMFYVDAQACETAAKTLNCSEAAPTAGRTAEGLKVPIASCPIAERVADPKSIGQGLADGTLEAIAGAKTIVSAATASQNYDAWLQMLTTYYNAVSKEGGSYIKNLMNSPFGTALQQSSVMTIVGNPSASLLYPAYQTAYQGYMAATTG